MSSDMASPPIQFDSDPALMAANTASGPNYGGYQSIYGNMNGGNMNFSHPGSYAVPSPATPPSLPPMHNTTNNAANNTGAYAPNGTNNFQFSYHQDAGSVPPPTPGVSVTTSVSGAPLSTPTGAQLTDAQQSPHPQQIQTHQVTPPQQHPQTPQQQHQQHQQQQSLQRPAHQPITSTQSPYQQSPQAHHPGMPGLMHGHPIYPGDARYDSRLQASRYMDPNMQMINRNGARPGDMTWAQPNGMIPDLLGANHAGGAGAAGPGAMRNMSAQQARVPVKAGMAMGGMPNMAMNGMNGMGTQMGGLGGIPGMPGMTPMGGDRLGGWGGLVGGSVGGPSSPYGQHHVQSPLQHQQPFHPHGLQQHPYPQPSPHLLHHPQGMQQHMGMHNRPGALGPVVGGGISKKKPKKPVVAAQVKDKNSPKRPRNSYIFFTLMK
ncbi:hypothetical protein BX616_000422, partial [Lobosporangium transversale]